MKKLLLISALFFPLLFICSFSQSGHWEKLTTVHHPDFRYSHGMAHIGNKKILLFGGRGRTGYLSDTWIFDSKKNDWDSIKCINFPSARSDFDMVQISENEVFLFGGRSDSTETNSDIWIFNLDSMNWHEKKALNQTEGRYWHKIAYLNQSEVLVFGGIRPRFQTTVYSNDTRIYNLDSNKWRSVEYSFVLDYNLQPRTGHFLSNIGEDSILLFGGANPSNSDECYKTWIYRKGYSWDSLNPLNSNIFLIFDGDMEKISNGLFLLFGGMTSHDPWYESTWIFNLKNKQWNELQLDVHPSGRRRHKMAWIDTNKIILYGGDNATVSPYETWLFTLDSSYIDIKKITDNHPEIKTYINTANGLILDYYLAESGKPEIEIFNINGISVFKSENIQTQSGWNREIIPVDILPAGVYFVRVRSGSLNLFEKFLVY